MPRQRQRSRLGPLASGMRRAVPDPLSCGGFPSLVSTITAMSSCRMSGIERARERTPSPRGPQRDPWSRHAMNGPSSSCTTGCRNVPHRRPQAFGLSVRFAAQHQAGSAQRVRGPNQACRRSRSGTASTTSSGPPVTSFRAHVRGCTIARSLAACRSLARSLRRAIRRLDVTACCELRERLTAVCAPAPALPRAPLTRAPRQRSLQPGAPFQDRRRGVPRLRR